MTTWNEVRDYARAQYTLTNDEEEFFTINFDYEGRAQVITVRKVIAYGQELLELRTGVCEQGDLDPVVALKKNIELPIGALALMDGLFVLIYRFPLANLEIEEFELPLHALAMTGDSLEELYSSRGDVF